MNGSSDTICVKVPTYQKLVIAANERNNLQLQLTTLDKQIQLLNSVISDLRDKDKLTVSSYEAQLKIANEQRGIMMDAIAGLNKDIRRIKRRVLFSKIAGGIGIGIMGWLYLSK